jgi:autotransporter-associated beta strand protein
MPSAWAPVTPPPGGNGIGDMLLLADGEVLAQIGTTNQWLRLVPDSAGNYNDGTWTTAASMSLRRQRFAANVLPDGRVVVLGGEHAERTGPGGFDFTSTGETYDPVANTWTPLDNYPGPLNGTPGWGSGPSPTELLSPISPSQSDGTLLAGSFWGGETWLLDPTQPAGQSPSGQWSKTGPKVGGAGSSEQSFVLLPDGTVLAYDDTRSNPTTFAADRYFPVTGQWVDASVTDGTAQPLTLYGANNLHENGAPTLLPPNLPDSTYPKGAVFWIGGDGQTALFNLDTNTWVGKGAIDGGGYLAADAPAALLPNGHVLLMAYANYLSAPTVLFDYSPVTNTYTPLQGTSSPEPDLSQVTAIDASMLELPNGHVLFSAGTQLWDYTPDTANTTFVPHVTNLSANGDRTYNLTGTYLTGYSEGAAQGDQFNGSATNYPIVKLTDTSAAYSPPNVFYAKTTGWIPGIQDPTSRSIKFELPANIPAGTYAVSVVASGISSADAVTISVGSANDVDRAPVYVDRAFAGLAAGAAVADADPVLPGAQVGTVWNSTTQSGNCFTSVQDAIDHAPGGATIVVNGSNGSTGSGDFGTETVTLNRAATLYVQRGTVTIATLAGNNSGAQVILHAGQLSLAGTNLTTEYDGGIYGSGSLAPGGAGSTLTLDGGVSIGSATVNAGLLRLNAPFTAVGGLTINGGSVADLADGLGHTTATVRADNGLTFGTANAYTLGGLGGDHSLSFGSAALTIGVDTDNTKFSGALSGTGGLTKVGIGSLTFAGTNSYTGGTTISAGSLAVNSDAALGNSAGTVTLNGGTLSILASFSSARSVTLGALGASISVPDTLSQFGLSAGLGSGTLTKLGSGYLLVGGNGIVPNQVLVENGTLVSNSPNSLASTVVGVLGTGSTLDVHNISVANVGGLYGDGAVLVEDAGLTLGLNDQSTVFSGSMTVSSIGTVTKAGSGTFTIAGSNDSFSNLLTVSQGAVVVTGSMSNVSKIQVNYGAVFGGQTASGSNVHGPITVDGTLQAGTLTAPGSFSIRDSNNALTMHATGTVTVRLGGTSPGNGIDGNAGFDSINVTGNVNLNGNLAVSEVGGFQAALGSSFDIIQVGASPPQLHYQISNAFANLPDQTVFKVGTQWFRIDYAPLYVRLTAVAPPPAIAGIQINDGNAQRSEVRSIAITFSTAVNFAGGNSNAAAAFDLEHINDGYTHFAVPRQVTTVAAVTTNASGQTVVTLTFSGAETDPFSVQYNVVTVAGPSLSDGRYTLRIDNSKITDANGVHLAGDGAKAGTDFTSPPDAYNPSGPPAGLALYRIYGDVNGDGVVDPTDLNEFRREFNSNSQDPNGYYHVYLDANDDGAIDPSDLNEFRTRFNVNVFQD